MRHCRYTIVRWAWHETVANAAWQVQHCVVYSTWHSGKCGMVDTTVANAAWQIHYCAVSLTWDNGKCGMADATVANAAWQIHHCALSWTWHSGYPRTWWWAPCLKRETLAYVRHGDNTTVQSIVCCGWECKYLTPTDCPGYCRKSSELFSGLSDWLVRVILIHNRCSNIDVVYQNDHYTLLWFCSDFCSDFFLRLPSFLYR